MPVDVFGRTMTARDSGNVIFRGINMMQANDAFLRRDGGNTITGHMDLNSHKLVNVADPTNDKDAANKEYVDSNAGASALQNKVSKTGDVVSGDLLFTLHAVGDDSRLIGCIDLPREKRFTIALGTRRNRLEFKRAAIGQKQGPVVLNTSHGFVVSTKGVNICQIGNDNLQAAIDVYKNIEMNNNRIYYLNEPVHGHEAATKNYVDRKMLNMSFLSYEGHIPPLERAISKTGFVVATSSNYDDLLHQGWRAFSNTNYEWATKGEGVGAWIQISCPTALRIWKIRLAGRKQSGEQFVNWKLSGGSVYNDTFVFVDIHTEHTRLSSNIQDFLINVPKAFNIYKLTALTVDPDTVNTGLSYFQIYRISDYGIEG